MNLNLKRIIYNIAQVFSKKNKKIIDTESLNEVKNQLAASGLSKKEDQSKIIDMINSEIKITDDSQVTCEMVDESIEFCGDNNTRCEDCTCSNEIEQPKKRGRKLGSTNKKKSVVKKSKSKSINNKKNK